MQQKKYFFHFSFFTLLFLSIIFLLPVKMEQTDEFGLMILASGIYTRGHESMLIFVSPIIGKFLNFLYSSNSEKYNWYSIFIVSVYFISWFSILNLVLRAKEFTREKTLGFYFLFLTFGVYFLLNFSFTVASFLLGIASILHYLFSEKTKVNVALFVVFFVACLLLRSFVFYYLMILFLGIIILGYLLNNRKIEFRQLSFLLIFASLFFLVNNNIISKNQEWKKFLDYNIVRGQLQDNPNFYFNNKDEIKLKMNWTETDYQMLYNWNTDIENKFNKNELQKLLRSIKTSTFWSLYYMQFVLANSIFYYVLILLLLFLVINRNFNLFFFLLVAFFLSTLVLTAQVYIMKERVFLPVLFLLFTLLLFNYKFEKSNYLLSVSALIFFIFINYQSYSKVLETQHQMSILKENKKVFDNFKQEDFVLWGDLKLNYFTGFYQPYLSLKGRIYISNWFSNSPHNIKILSKRNTKSIYEYSVQNSNCLWIVEKDKFEFKSNLLRQCYLENYGLNVVFEKITTSKKNTWILFKIKKIILPI